MCYLMIRNGRNTVWLGLVLGLRPCATICWYGMSKYAIAPGLRSKFHFGGQARWVPQSPYFPCYWLADMNGSSSSLLCLRDGLG